MFNALVAETAKKGRKLVLRPAYINCLVTYGNPLPSGAGQGAMMAL
jgi:hypothetical protein